MRGAVLLVLVVVVAACTAEGGRRAGDGETGRDATAGSVVRCGEDRGAVRWRALESPPAHGADGVVIEDVLPGGAMDAGTRAGAEPWVAVGERVVGGGEFAPAAWRFRDAHWVADRTAPVTLFGREQRLIGVGRHGRRLVAMGLFYSDYEARPRPSAWLEEGGTWREVPTLRELFGGPRTVDMKDIAGGELGFVAVGPRDDRRGRQMAGVWRSQDGLDWAWPPQDTPLTGRPSEVVTPLAVTVGTAGVVVVGTTLPTTDVLPRVEDGAVWWSGDGRGWERVETGAAFGGAGTQQPTAVTWTGRSFVAVGVTADGVGARLRPAAWVSPDGRSWRRAPAGAFAGGGGEADARLTAVAAANGCVVAGGLVGTTPRLWTSGDGLSWTPLPAPAGALDAHGKVLVGVGGGLMLVVLSEPTRSRLWTAAVAPAR